MQNPRPRWPPTEAPSSSPLPSAPPPNTARTFASTITKSLKKQRPFASRRELLARAQYSRWRGLPERKEVLLAQFGATPALQFLHVASHRIGFCHVPDNTRIGAPGENRQTFRLRFLEPRQRRAHILRWQEIDVRLAHEIGHDPLIDGVVDLRIAPFR